jgi:hypothetical protein
MPLDRICLGVEILIISMRHHHHGMGRRVDSSSMEFLVLARRGASFCCATRKKYYVFVFVLLVPAERWHRRSAPTEFLSFTEPNSPPIADSNTPSRKKTRKKEISPKKAKRAAELRNVNRLKHSAGRDNFQADTKGT